MQAPQCLDNLRAALNGIPRGEPKVRVIKGRKYVDGHHVEWLTADAIAVCELIIGSRVAVGDKAFKKARDIRAGCVRCGRAETVIHNASCLYVLLDAANLIYPPPVTLIVPAAAAVPEEDFAEEPPTAEFPVAVIDDLPAEAPAYTCPVCGGGNCTPEGCLVEPTED